MMAPLDVSPANCAAMFRQFAPGSGEVTPAARIEVGERLPPEGVLAAQIAVSRPAVRAALVQHPDRGLTETAEARP
jgi:Bacterial regulatory proteins, gntR family